MCLLRAALVVAAITTYLGSVSGQPQSNALCHMMYLSADNNLEDAIIKDMSELSGNSQFTGREGYGLYIVIDRGFATTSEVIPNTYSGAFGSPVLRQQATDKPNLYELHDGILYQRTSEVNFFMTEINMDSGLSLYHFMKWAIAKCQTKFKDYNKILYFLQAGSHGYGWYGFGGDWLNEVSPKGSKVLQNLDFASKATEALIEAGISKLDMLGFDACYMASVWTLSDFSTMTKYFIAAETTEPFHGWAYNELKADWTDLTDLAKDIVTTFVNSLHGLSGHVNSPKILAVFDTAIFSSFKNKLDVVWQKLADGMESGHKSTFTGVTRALAAATKWSTATDGAITNKQTGQQYSPRSAVDLVSFLDKLGEMCIEGSNQGFIDAVSDVKRAYEDMLVYFEARGAADGTGLHIWIPELLDFINGDFIRSLICGTAEEGVCPFTGKLFLSTTVALKNFFRSYFGGFDVAPDSEATVICALDDAGGELPDCEAISDDILCQALATQQTVSNGKATTTTTPGPGCQSYDLYQLITAGQISGCGLDGGMQYSVSLASEVIAVKGEVLVTTEWVGGDKTKPIAYITHSLNTKFNGVEASAAMEGYFYMICSGDCNPQAKGNALVTAIQENAKNEWKVQVLYFSKGIKAQMDEANQVVNPQQALKGYLYFKSLGGLDVIETELFIQSNEAGAVAVGRDLGGEIVTRAEPQAPVVGAQIVLPRYGGPFSWGRQGIEWKIQSLRLGSPVASVLFLYGTILVHLETSFSLGTQCYAKTVFLNMRNIDDCATAISAEVDVAAGPQQHAIASAGRSLLMAFAGARVAGAVV